MRFRLRLAARRSLVGALGLALVVLVGSGFGQMLWRPAFRRGLEVVDKTGELDAVTSDAGLILVGPNGPYVLAVFVDGPGGDAGLSPIA